LIRDQPGVLLDGTGELALLQQLLGLLQGGLAIYWHKCPDEIAWRMEDSASVDRIKQA
jgi:hypothetical protein